MTKSARSRPTSLLLNPHDTAPLRAEEMRALVRAREERLVSRYRHEEEAAMTAQITISLDIPEVRVISVEQNERGEWTITVESTIEGTRRRLCGRELKELHGVDEAITLRHLPILGRPVYLRLRPKRYRCPDCDGGPTTTQQLSWYNATTPHTKAYEKYI